MRILALDIGFKRVGVAVSNLDRSLIYPVSVIEMDRFNGRIFFKLLNDSLNEIWNEIDSVVVGDGCCSGEENSIVKIISQVERILRSWTNWNINFISEVNSSVESRSFLKNIGLSSKQSMKFLDSYAALFILKEYFNSLNKEVMVSF